LVKENINSKLLVLRPGRVLWILLQHMGDVVCSEEGRNFNYPSGIVGSICFQANRIGGFVAGRGPRASATPLR
jgi:hypothetical protein